MYTYMWIEGWEQLLRFCRERFNMDPYICEHSGHCGPARIHLKYKEDKDGIYHQVFFLFMESPRGEYTYCELHDKIERDYDYEQIRTDRRAILRTGGARHD